MINKDRVDYSFKTGRIVEDRWRSIFPESIKSSRKDDMEKHIDFYIGNKSVDVKGNNAPHQIWLEIKNVRGEKGWVYGEATHIAFDFPEMKGFVVLEREKLKDYIAANIEKEFASKSDCYKKLYSRRGREDVITCITITDLTSIPHSVVEYSRKYTHPASGDLISF
jgi:hypothetical protein